MFTKNNKRNLDNALKKARGVLVRNGKLYIQFKEKNKHGYTRKSTKFRAEAVNVKLAYTKLIKIQDAIAKDEYDEEKFFGKKSNKTVYKTSIEKLGCVLNHVSHINADTKLSMAE